MTNLTMKSLTLLTIVFCGGTVWVGADFYVEFRAPATEPSTSRAQPPMVNFLYECRGIPAGVTAFTASRSACAPVTSNDQKEHIHATCSFYSVYRANLRGRVIQLSDRGVLTSTDWMLGYRINAPDHPNFGNPSQDDIDYFTDRLNNMVVDAFIPHYLAQSLASYFAQTNLISFSMNMASANSHFISFATFLKRIMDKYHNRDEEQQTALFTATLKDHLNNSMKIALHKMIDPCGVLIGNLQKYASQYCAIYCYFLRDVAIRYGISAVSCQFLQGGRCVGVVCTCDRVMVHRFGGCRVTFSAVQQCSNALRARVN